MSGMTEKMTEKLNNVKNSVTKSDEEWREQLTVPEYRVLREAGTERAGSGILLGENRPGTYFCKACGAKLFRSEKKFESFCGWPSFFDPDENDAVRYLKDYLLGYERIEVRCAACNSHLGHVFDDAPQTPTGKRYCMNSVCLTFHPDGEPESARVRG
ncbi:peptide-methionine (R)-S-oxide reductase MsrB [Arcanobacterium hippocoleae]